MILAVGGEFVNCVWDPDGSLVALDMDGHERVRVTWTNWPNRTRVEKLQIVWDVCTVLLFPDAQLRNARRRLDCPDGRTFAPARATGVMSDET
jgi:hypothetical protein